MQQSLRASDEEREQRDAFFRTVFGKYSGHVCLARLDRKKKFREDFFFYPDQLSEMHDHIEKHLFTHNQYFCPQLLAAPSRKKVDVQTCTCLWSDLDTANPTGLSPVPSVVLESSPEKYQAFWPLKAAVEPVDAEDYSRRIAYAYQAQGADTSGWDLTQLLRVPLTLNFKYERTLSIPIVQILDADPTIQFTLDDFAHLEQVPGYEHLSVPMPESLPSESAEDILQRHRKNLPDKALLLFGTMPEKGDWSKALWNLECLLLEAGLTREETYIVCRDGACNKFARDNKDPAYLWKDICRAAEALREREGILVPSLVDTPSSILTPEEFEYVESLDDTFIERYCKWGELRGDAAPEYHVAGAFTVLSGLLCGSVELPTSYGVVYPNLWFMLLADTTLTRKTTAIDMAMDLLMDVDPDIVLATDGSVEGLVTSLGTRAGKPSVFWRDEFSGLIEQMKRKDYMAGMPEMFTKMYDGKYQKRVLKKEVVEVRDPRLIIFSGAVYNRTVDILDYTFVTSGFLPRFILITAEPDLSKLRPLGPATQVTDDGRSRILKEVQHLRDTYQQTEHRLILGVQMEVPKVFQAEMAPEGWARFNQLENDLILRGVDSEVAELTTPTYDRLSKSILKAAVLIAAAEKSVNAAGNVYVLLSHLLRAMHYGDSWKQHVEKVLVNVGRSTLEAKLQTLLRRIEREPGVTRSRLMQSYHLTAREMEQYIDTLDQRGLITADKAGKSYRYYPIKLHTDGKRGLRVGVSQAPRTAEGKILMNTLGGVHEA